MAFPGSMRPLAAALPRAAEPFPDNHPLQRMPEGVLGHLCSLLSPTQLDEMSREFIPAKLQGNRAREVQRQINQVLKSQYRNQIEKFEQFLRSRDVDPGTFRDRAMQRIGLLDVAQPDDVPQSIPLDYLNSNMQNCFFTLFQQLKQAGKLHLCEEFADFSCLHGEYLAAFYFAQRSSSDATSLQQCREHIFAVSAQLVERGFLDTALALSALYDQDNVGKFEFVHDVCASYVASPYYDFDQICDLLDRVLFPLVDQAFPATDPDQLRDQPHVKIELLLGVCQSLVECSKPGPFNLERAIALGDRAIASFTAILEEEDLGVGEKEMAKSQLSMKIRTAICVGWARADTTDPMKAYRFIEQRVSREAALNCLRGAMLQMECIPNASRELIRRQYEEYYRYLENHRS